LSNNDNDDQSNTEWTKQATADTRSACQVSEWRIKIYWPLRWLLLQSKKQS